MPHLATVAEDKAFVAAVLQLSTQRMLILIVFLLMRGLPNRLQLVQFVASL